MYTWVGALQIELIMMYVYGLVTQDAGNHEHPYIHLSIYTYIDTYILKDLYLSIFIYMFIYTYNPALKWPVYCLMCVGEPQDAGNHEHPHGRHGTRTGEATTRSTEILYQKVGTYNGMILSEAIGPLHIDRLYQYKDVQRNDIKKESKAIEVHGLNLLVCACCLPFTNVFLLTMAFYHCAFLLPLSCLLCYRRWVTWWHLPTFHCLVILCAPLTFHCLLVLCAVC
jgi:hypothetical protein